MALALCLSVALGGLVGYEREIRGHPAGLRTHILVSLGSCLFTLLSIRIASAEGMKGNPGHIAAQVVTGIGFLGAGAILRDGGHIKGLTTAASIWMTAAIGMAAGAGPVFGQLAVVATVIVLFTLTGLHQLELRLNAHVRRTLMLDVHVQETAEAVAQVLSLIHASQLAVISMESHPGERAGIRELHLKVRPQPDFDRQRLMDSLTRLPDTTFAAMEE
jgi:putative Mg2+ transporter-C (MgtC) family protein